MDRETLRRLEEACHIRLTEEETALFLTELQEIEDSYPTLPDEGVLPHGAAELPFAAFREDKAESFGDAADRNGRMDERGFFTVKGAVHE